MEWSIYRKEGEGDLVVTLFYFVSGALPPIGNSRSKPTVEHMAMAAAKRVLRYIKKRRLEIS